jgi:hypothetical protein
MPRRWPVLAATIPLLFGWALAAAYPAAASTGIQGPGGLVIPGDQFIDSRGTRDGAGKERGEGEAF